MPCFTKKVPTGHKSQRYSSKIVIVADKKMIVRGEVGALLLLPLLTSSLPNNVRIGEYTP
jgi:hypothetical protein